MQLTASELSKSSPFNIWFKTNNDSLYIVVNHLRLNALYIVLKKFIEKNTFILKTDELCAVYLINKEKNTFQEKLFSVSTCCMQLENKAIYICKSVNTV